MITVEEALEHVGRCARQLAPTEVSLREALGLRLAEPGVGPSGPHPAKLGLEGFDGAGHLG